MKISGITLQIILVFLALTSSELQARKIECHSGNNIRIIETRYPADDNIACTVNYHKPSEGVASEILWNARNDVEYCGNKSWLLANKLEDGGWSCEAIYEATQGTTVVRSARQTNGTESSDAPDSPLAFRQFLEQRFGVIFDSTTDYHYAETQQNCIATDCKNFFDYLSRVGSEPLDFFGYKVNSKITLWTNLECGGSHCFARTYEEKQGEFQKVSLPEIESGEAFSIFLKSKNEGFPDLWVPVAHGPEKVVEVELLRYHSGSYKRLAHLFAKADPAAQVTESSEPAFEPGIVTLNANFEGEQVELVYRTNDIDYEGLLLNPGQ